MKIISTNYTISPIIATIASLIIINITYYGQLSSATEAATAIADPEAQIIEFKTSYHHHHHYLPYNDINANNYRQQGQCQQRRAEEAARTSSLIDTTFRCPTPFGHFGREQDCRTYYWCHEDIAYLRLCPPFMQYDDRFKRCNTILTGAGPCYRAESFDCPKPNGRFPHYSRCDRHFVCRDGKSYLRECPYWTSFDTSVMRCVLWIRARCELTGSRPTGAPVTEGTTSNPSNNSTAT